MPTTPLFLNLDGVYAGKHLALPWGDVVSQGVILSGAPVDPLKVAAVAPAAMAVEIAPGAAWVKNDAADAAAAYYDGGTWRTDQRSAFQVPIEAADPTNPRVDRVVLEVLDSQFGGASNLARFRVVKGTPAGSPAAPAEPSNAITLATVLVAAAATSIAAGAITDARPVAATGGGKAAGGGGLVAHAENTTGLGSVGATGEAGANVVVADIQRTFEAVPHLFTFYCPSARPALTLGTTLTFLLHDGSGPIGNFTTMQNTASGAQRVPVNGTRRLVPSAGLHTYSVRAYASAGGLIQGGPGGPGEFMPISLRITKD